MGRQNNDSAVVGPSIALLQERFRKLERMKEKREEERQLMFSAEPKRMIISTNNSNSITDELFLPSRPAFQDPLSLALNLNTKHADYKALKSAQSSFNSSWSADKRGVKRAQKFDISDVDTSLHL